MEGVERTNVVIVRGPGQRMRVPPRSDLMQWRWIEEETAMPAGNLGT